MSSQGFYCDRCGERTEPMSMGECRYCDLGEKRIQEPEVAPTQAAALLARAKNYLTLERMKAEKELGKDLPPSELERDLYEYFATVSAPATTATGEDFKNALRERAESANTLNDELKKPGLILEPATTATGGACPRCEEARKILFAYSDNEGTANPWWGVVKPGSFGRNIFLEGPFFSRERANELCEARRHEWGPKAFVYCYSGNRSEHYRDLRAALAPPAPSHPRGEG